MELNKKMAEFIDLAQEGYKEDLIRNKDLLNEIADYCRETKLYKNTESQRITFSKDLTSEECYKHLIIKVANAPTMTHAQFAAIMVMPIIADKLKEEVQ